MKKILLIHAFCILFNAFCFAQNVGINTTMPDASAVLDIKANNKGILIPRTSTVSRTAIVSPAKGLMIYDTSTNSFWYHDGMLWVETGITKNEWGINGNVGTNPATHFIGTTDAQALTFKINNNWAGQLSTSNTYFGSGAGNATGTGSGNNAIGINALNSNTTGTYNTASGIYALGFNTTGYNNTANGDFALFNNTTGYNNTVNGDEASKNNTN